MMKKYFTILVLLIVFDIVWLWGISRPFYEGQLVVLGKIFTPQFIIWPALLFYIMYAFGVLYFVVNPALEAKSLRLALFRGAFLGLIAYATYDLTNQATIQNWPVLVTIADVAWGVCATALVSLITYKIITKSAKVA